MAVVIPWQDNPDFQFEIALDSFVYFFRIRWNHIAKSWALDMFTRSKTEISMGIRLVHSQDLLHGLVGEFAPPGGLFVVGLEPYYSSFLEKNSQLVYLTEDEVLAL